ncbi:hypothetical protein DRQ36_10750, partial [bacterium]
IEIHGDTFALFDGYASWIDDSFTFYSGLAGLFFAGGDTIDVCIYAADSAEGCGVNKSDTCWEFYIPVTGPTAEMIWPFDGAWISCPESLVIFRIEDSDGVVEDSIWLVVGVDTFRVSCPELTWLEPFLYFDISVFPDGTISGTLSAKDILGNAMDPPLVFSIGIDTSPPYLSGETPTAGSSIYDLDPTVTFDIIDDGAGMMHGPTLAGVSVDGSSTSWFSLSDIEFSLAGDTYTLDSTTIPPLHGGDTVTIRVLANDSVDVCNVNMLDTSWFFYVPYSPPDIELILPPVDIVSACSMQGVWYKITDSDGIIGSSIELSILGSIYDTNAAELAFADDTLRYEPLSPWPHGVYIDGELISAEDSLLNNISASIPFGFHIDLEPPQIISISPDDHSLSTDTLKMVRIRLEDIPAGVDTATIQVTIDGLPRMINGTSLRWESPYLIYDPFYASAWDIVDTVEFCLSVVADKPDTCGPNWAEPYCWTFYIDGRDPSANPPDGAIVACTEQEVKIYVWAPGGIIDTTILIEINGLPFTIENPELTFENDTLRYSPIVPWPDGDSVRCLLVHAAGPISSIDSVYWGFLMDYSPPLLLSTNPAPGEIIESVDPPITFVLADSISGLLHGAFNLTVNGNVFGWEHPSLSIIGDSFALDIASAGLHLAGGDTANICIHAEDFASPDYCGPNVIDTCYSFSIESGGPVADLLSPPELSPYGCDSVIVIGLTDDDGYNWPTLIITIDNDTLFYGDGRLTIFGDSLLIAPSILGGDTVTVGFLALEDSLENGASPQFWQVIFDFGPPQVDWLFPSPDTTLTTTSPNVVALVRDGITGAFAEPIPMESFTRNGDTLFITPSSVGDYDTIDLCVFAEDSAICANADTVCIRFYIDAAPPVAYMVVPSDSATSACDPQRIVLLLTDPSGIDPTGLSVVIGSDTIDLTNPDLRLLGDSLVFEPDTGFLPGEIIVEIVFAQDRWGNVLSGFEALFYQVAAPAIIDVSPAPGSSSPVMSPLIYAILDGSADSGCFVIGSDTFTLGDSGFDFSADSLSLSTEIAGLVWSAGDTVDICAYSAVPADFCGPAVAESCWSFYILYSPPDYTVIYPECNSWTACLDSGIVFGLSDDEGIDTLSLLFSACGDTFDIADDELSYDPISGELTFAPDTNWTADTIRFCILYLQDILGAAAGGLPFCCEQWLDTEPPEVAFDPPPGTYLPVPIDTFEFTIIDFGSGGYPDSVSVDGSGSTIGEPGLEWEPPVARFDLWPLIGTPAPDTITVCVRASDSVLYCGPNDTLVCFDYPINTTAPTIDM